GGDYTAIVPSCQGFTVSRWLNVWPHAAIPHAGTFSLAAGKRVYVPTPDLLRLCYMLCDPARRTSAPSQGIDRRLLVALPVQALLASYPHFPVAHRHPVRQSGPDMPPAIC